MSGNHLANRYHDISCGHRVYGHESKCAHLHGHNYRIHFAVAAVPLRNQHNTSDLDAIGRVMDFSVIKEKLCMWLEDNWDHKFLIWWNDPMRQTLQDLDPDGVVVTSFNPTAENMAEYLVEIIAPHQLKGTGCFLQSCTIEETRKCSVNYLK